MPIRLPPSARPLRRGGAGWRRNLRRDGMKQVEEILADLVAIPSVCRTPNGAIVDYVRSYLAEHGVAATVLPGPEGDRANLFATIGPAEVPGMILSAHLDVVP